MPNYDWKKISFAIVFLTISLMLLSIKPILPPVLVVYSGNNGIYVPPAEDSHFRCCPGIEHLSLPNTWDNKLSSNNIPGLLPGPSPGEQLGLENNPILSLSTPIRAPLVDGY